jgi:hypothetical protein
MPKAKNKSDTIEKMKRMSFCPIALSPPHVKKYNLEARVDFLEYYHICYNPHFLYPIDTTKMFTMMFKDNQDISPFEMIYDQILLEYPDVQLYQLQIRDQVFPDADQATFLPYPGDFGYVKLSEYSGNYIPTTKSRMEMEDVTKVIFIENQQSEEFGHYGIIFYDGKQKTYSYFDSMVSFYSHPLLPNGGIVQSAYFKRFVEAFKFYFSDPNIVVTIEESSEYQICKNSSLEIIGGEIRLDNPYTEHLLKNENNLTFYANQTIMGVDTQNQYCFMWGFAYTFAKLHKGWKALFKKITCDQSIIPVCFIKYFSSFIINWMNDPTYKSRKQAYQTLERDEMFRYFYNSFISNSSVYHECFSLDSPEKETFHLYLNKKGLELLQSGEKKTIPGIVDSLFSFCDEYQQNVLIVEMPPANSTFTVSDCGAKKVDYNNIIIEHINLTAYPPQFIIDYLRRSQHPLLLYATILHKSIEAINDFVVLDANGLPNENGLTFSEYSFQRMKACLDENGKINDFNKFMIYLVYGSLLKSLRTGETSLHINNPISILCDETNMNDKITITSAGKEKGRK